MTNDANKLLRQADRCKKLRTKAVQQIIIARDKGAEIVSIELTVEELTDIAILCGNNETILRRRVREIKRDELSSADVQPVKHGNWLKRMSTSDSLKCSVCGNDYKCPTTYCPNCGARMDGDAE